jgi:hypothetical protein
MAASDMSQLLEFLRDKSLYPTWNIYDYLSTYDFCGLVVRVPGYRTRMYCASCEVRTEFICYAEVSRPPLWSSGQSSWLHNGDVLCFPWGTSWVYICYVEESRPPLWSGCQSSRLQIQKSGFDSRRYQIFWEVVHLERGPLSLVSAIDELLGRKGSGSGLEIRE